MNEKNLKHVSASVEIDAPASAVFDNVTNWQEQEKWVFLTKVQGIGDDSRRLGGKLEAFTGIGKLGFIDTMTITDWDNPKLCEVTHTGNVVKDKGVFTVSTKNSLTYFTWTEYVELPFGFIGRLGWIFAKPLVKLGLRSSLKRLKKHIEGKA